MPVYIYSNCNYIQIAYFGKSWSFKGPHHGRAHTRPQNDHAHESCASGMRMSRAHRACACVVRIGHAHEPCAPGNAHESRASGMRMSPGREGDGDVTDGLAGRTPGTGGPLLHALTGAAATRNRCDYKFLRNTPTSDINTARRALRRSASRALAAVIPVQNCSVNVQRIARIAATSASVAVAGQRHSVSPELHSNGKFDAVACGEDGGTCPPDSHRLSRHPESTTQRGLV